MRRAIPLSLALLTGFVCAAPAMSRQTPESELSRIQAEYRDETVRARRLRADGRYRDIPIIAFTSTVSENFRDKGTKVGLSTMILKTDREALVSAIAEHLNEQKEAA